jgi:hypothetical protein
MQPYFMYHDVTVRTMIVKWMGESYIRWLIKLDFRYPSRCHAGATPGGRGGTQNIFNHHWNVIIRRRSRIQFFFFVCLFTSSFRARKDNSNGLNSVYLWRNIVYGEKNGAPTLWILAPTSMYKQRYERMGFEILWRRVSEQRLMYNNGEKTKYRLCANNIGIISGLKNVPEHIGYIDFIKIYMYIYKNERSIGSSVSVRLSSYKEVKLIVRHLKSV